jgi:tetratricopeptide (TPR) repeat protein
MNNYATADMAYNEALTLAGIHKDTRLEALVLLNMAQLDQHRGNHIRALDILNKVRGRLEKANKQRLLAVCYSRMAFSYMVENRLEEALSSVKELEELAEQKDDKILMASAHFRRGSIYLKREKFSKALPEFQRTEVLFRGLGDVKNLALVICDLARVYINLGKVRNANSLLKEATALAQKTDSENVLCKIKIILADKAVLKKSWGQARGFYEEALTKAEAIDNEDRFHYLHESLGKTVKKMGFNLPGLESLLKRALESYVRLGLKREAEETQRWLAQISLTE